MPSILAQMLSWTMKSDLQCQQRRCLSIVGGLLTHLNTDASILTHALLYFSTPPLPASLISENIYPSGRYRRCFPDHRLQESILGSTTITANSRCLSSRQQFPCRRCLSQCTTHHRELVGWVSKQIFSTDLNTLENTKSLSVLGSC